MVAPRRVFVAVITLFFVASLLGGPWMRISNTICLAAAVWLTGLCARRVIRYQEIISLLPAEGS